MKTGVMAIIIALMTGITALENKKSAEIIYTNSDLKNLRNYILSENLTDPSEKDYDLNNDSKCNSLDLCMMRKAIITQKSDNIEFGTQIKNDFIVDNVLHSDTQGDIHFSICIPESYDGSEPYALFVTLPGWEGLYFQGIGANLVEGFPFEAKKYNDKMIIISTQLNDWGETSADMTIELTEYLINNYNIDTSKVYLHGMSGGGETGSIIMGKRPELYTAYLETSSKWDGDLEVLAKAKTPVYMAIAENDTYYGSGYLKSAYNTLYELYQEQGLTENEINDILVLDVKPDEYFTERGYHDQHAGGNAFSADRNVMGWLFGKTKKS